MIVFGLRMQGKPEAVPKEVAAWLLERNTRYPNIDFSVDRWEPHPSQADEAASTARKYSRLYQLKSRLDGVLIVSFLYLREYWQVKLVGGLDKDGNIADRSKEQDIRPLPTELRNEIAGLPVEAQKLSDTTLAVLREENNAAVEKPIEMIPIPPDFRWTSEVSMSGGELINLLNDPNTKAETESAMWNKDWETLKRLKSSKAN